MNLNLEVIISSHSNVFYLANKAKTSFFLLPSFAETILSFILLFDIQNVFMLIDCKEGKKEMLNSEINTLFFS